MSSLELSTEHLGGVKVNASGKTLFVADATVVETHFLGHSLGRSESANDEKSNNLKSAQYHKKEKVEQKMLV